MAFSKSDYSRTSTRDVRSAMALALARHLASLSFSAPTQRFFSFTEVFEEWPSYGDKYVPPVACITPTPWTYGESRLTPTLIPDTWEPKNEFGPLQLPGYGLYAISEIEATFEVSIRCTSNPEREAIIKGIEESFNPISKTDLFVNVSRYGILLPMPEYWNLEARFSLKTARLADNEAKAIRNQQEAVLTFLAQACQVFLGPVRPMTLKIRQEGC